MYGFSFEESYPATVVLEVTRKYFLKLRLSRVTSATPAGIPDFTNFVDIQPYKIR